MKVRVKIQRTKEDKKIDISSNSTVEELLNIININSTTVIVTRKNKVISEDMKLKKNDDIEILSVISGG